MSLMLLERLTVRRGSRVTLAGISMGIGPGEVVGLIGPNGAGKTTLLRAALGLIAHEGRSSLAELPRAARAKAVAFLPQGREVAWPVALEDLVALGRGIEAEARADHPSVARALARMGLEGLRKRPATELSGGELARALIARALAQEAPLLLADEPVAGLDPESQIACMETFAALAREEGRGVLVSIHDLGLAMRHCTRLVMLSGGHIVADGAPAEVLLPDLLAQVFHITAYSVETPLGPVFQPLGRSR